MPLISSQTSGIKPSHKISCHSLQIKMEKILRAAVFLFVVCLATKQVLGQNATETFRTVTMSGYNFSVSDYQLPWAQAVNACTSIGQTLATVESPEKDDILVQLFSENKENNNVTLTGNTWIAATEIREGVWHWNTTGKPLYYSRWFMDGQPDDTENLNCVYLASQWLLYWRDANCSASMYFICEGEEQKDDGGGDGSSGSSQVGQSALLLSICGLLALVMSSNQNQA